MYDTVSLNKIMRKGMIFNYRQTGKDIKTFVVIF